MNIPVKIKLILGITDIFGAQQFCCYAYICLQVNLPTKLELSNCLLKAMPGGFWVDRFMTQMYILSAP